MAMFMARVMGCFKINDAFLGGMGACTPPQKILKTRTPEMPFPAIWALIFSAKIAIGDDLIINLNKILLLQD